MNLFYVAYAEATSTGSMQKTECDQHTESTKVKRTPLRWECQSTEHLLKLVCEELKKHPKCFEKPTAQRFYKKITAKCPRLQKKCWISLKNKMQACRLHFIKARKWAHESGSNIRAFGCEKAVKDYLNALCPYYDMLNIIFGREESEGCICNDDNKSCNNNGDEDLVAYFEAFDKLLNNDNCDNNNYDHNASNCCDQSDSMASDKEEGKCKKPEEVVYRKGICHKKEHGISVVESRLVHSESRDMAGMQSCAQISSLRETNKSEEMCEIREDSTCSFNETQQKPILDCDKKQKKSVSKKTSASLLSFEKKRLEVEHERLELEKKKFEWQQEKEGRELKLKQTELERMFELKKCELAKEERIEKEKIKLQLEHEARLKEYEMEMKTRQNRSTTSCRSCNNVKNND